jgi:myo-inositol-1(or 4)-monophosphatase
VKSTLLQCVTEAGALLLKYFGKVRNIRQKDEPSSVVCEADLASEELVARLIRTHFPDACIIGEEGGCSGSPSEFTWVVDPLDGTSNFVAGLPWFGAQIGVLQDSKPICAAMYLPVLEQLYFAAKGKGAWEGKRRLRTTPETDLKKTLCAFGFDPGPTDNAARRVANLLTRVARGVRNTRATNSLVDFCYTLEGRFGTCVNLNCKIWDIVPAAVMLPEADGAFTDFAGAPIDFTLGQEDPSHSYQVVGGSRVLHRKMVRLLKG